MPSSEDMQITVVRLFALAFGDMIFLFENELPVGGMHTNLL
jgi:hypothetical protein